MSEFRIGQVAEMTGVPAPTIRTWERRYGALGPPRSGVTSHRRYTPEQVERLRLLKRAVDEGEAIRSVARMSDEDLRRRFHDGDGSMAAGPIRLGVIHGALAAALKPDFLDMVVDVPSGEAIESGQWDALVIDSEKVDVAGFEVPAGPLVFLTYHFASSRQLLEWEDRGWIPLRAPLTAHRLQRLIRRELGRRVQPHRPAAPRYTPAMLQSLQEIESSIECECLNNLAAILESVMAFERYCARCENQTPDDAALHNRLGRESAEIRQRVERMLERVILHDGLDLDDLYAGKVSVSRPRAR